MGLITLTTAKTNPVLSAVDDTTLQSMIDAATNIIERYCDTKFEEATVEDTLDGNDSDYIFVKNNYVTALNTVNVVESDATETSLDTDNITFNNQEDRCRIAFINGNEFSYTVFPKGKNNIKINYTYGYSDIPDDLQQACLQLTLSLYQTSQRKYDTNLDSERLGEYSYKIGSSGGIMFSGSSLIPQNVADMLASYRRVIF